MRRFSQLLWFVSILSVPLSLHSQQAEITIDPGIFARLEYATSAATMRHEVRHVCLAISNDGEYQIVRSTVDQPTQYLRGQMSKEQSEHLKGLLSSKEFRSQKGIFGSLILQDSESFRAEMPIPLKKRADGTYIIPESGVPEDYAWHLEWLNADGGAPFPASIDKVVHFLRSFEPKDGEEFDYTEFSQVCPSGSLRRVQPSIAENEQR